MGVKLHVDLETLQLIQGPGQRSAVAALRFKRGDAARLQVVFLENGVTPATIGDPGALEIQIGIKPRNQFDRSYLAHSADWSMPSEGDDTPAYGCSVSFNTLQLNSALNIGSPTAEELPEVTLMGEITWREGAGEPTSTRIFLVVVENDVNRGDEGTPLAEMDPAAWLSARAVRHDEAQSLTSEQKAQARANIGASSPVESFAVASPVTLTLVSDWAANTVKGYPLLDIPSYWRSNNLTVGGLSIGQGVRTIGDSSFNNCTNLQSSLVFPSSLISIGNAAFYNCLSASGSVVIPDSVEVIGETAFGYYGHSTDCGSLTLGSGLVTIKLGAFFYSKFKGVLTIPPSVRTIELNAFQGTLFTGPLVIPNSVTSIGSGAFSVSQFQSLELGTGITSIPDLAFNQCPITGTLTIPNNVTAIGSSAFAFCAALTGLSLPTGLTTIGVSAFQGCEQLVGTLAIPNSVTSIGASAFYGCRKLTGISIGSNVTTIGDSAFRSCDKAVGSLILPNSLTSAGISAFQGCLLLTSVTLPTNANFISIPASMFEACSKLSGTLVIPGNVHMVGADAFLNCTAITGLTLSEGVQTLGLRAFKGLRALAGTVVIPSTVTSIANSVFDGCANVTRIEIRRATAPAITNLSFNGMVGVSQIHVPSNATGYAASYSGKTVVYDLPPV